jgi:hypothetical protein
MRRKDPNRATGAPVMETMEPRLLLTGALVISEFMADNTKTLKDKDGAYSDWLEICNTGVLPANLNGYYLTDSSSNLTKWRFPSVTVPAGGYLVVFASGKNITTGAELHTNFKLGAGGDYLALVQPDGHTISFEYAPQYPSQFPDISYGVETSIATKTLVGPDAAVAALVPVNNSLGLDWTNYTFDDSSWTLRGTNPVGYESTVAGWAIRDYFANINPLATLDQAESVISTPANRRDATVYSQTASSVNFRNTGGDAYFSGGLNPPGINPAYTSTLNFAMEARGWVTISQAGLYTFGVNSDDGFGLTITGATTTWTQNSTTPAGSGVMDWQGTRTSADTFATYSFPAAGQYPIRLVWFQAASANAEVELFATAGNYRAFNYTDYKLVGDTANGGLAVQSVPVVPNTYDSLIRTDVKSAMKGVNASAYIRIPFTVTDTSQYDSLTLRMMYDDGYVAYLNGVEIARKNAPGTVTWNSSALTERARASAVAYEDVDVTSKLGYLRLGTNVLAIQALNYGASNEDLLIGAQLVDNDIVAGDKHFFATATPGSANLPVYFAFVADTKFSVDRGFYDSPIDVTITTATEGAQIRYTTDGSAPTATTGTVYTAPVHITTTTTLRAAAFLTGFQPTNVDTETYIFVNDVVNQPANPAGFPTTWGPVTADYAMDQSVVNNPLYKAEIRSDLKVIPSLSIVMNTSQLFGAAGIYSNTQQQGEAWERAASMELINPDGTPGFQVDGGLRIYGGVDRDPTVKKHTFRFFFNDNQFGPADLKYQLFPDSPVDSFDSVILKGYFNDAWGPMSWGGQSQYARDTWAMASVLAMGQPASHTRYFHLYVNGLYWGMYCAMERPDQHFSADYLGGDEHNYDAIHDMEAVAGNLTAWNQMMAAANAGLTTDTAYQAFQQMVDVKNLADTCTFNFYTQNWDWDDHNWYAGRDRTGGQWHWYPWDTEWILPSDYVSASNMINTNLSNRGSHVFQQLRQNADFKMLVADELYKNYISVNGPMTPTALASRYQAITDQIYYAIVDESARWGDYNRAGNAYTRNAEWAAERSRLLNTYFPQRGAVFVSQMRTAGLYPTTNPAGFSQEGGTIAPGFQATLTNPNTTGTPPTPVGTIYYTVDGSDPRLAGGGISPTALVYTGPITLQVSTMLRTRVKNGTEWSAMHEAAFVLTTPPALRITELMYHPENPPPNSQYSAKDFEYIEVKNTGTKPLDIGGFMLKGAVTFTFPTMTLPAGGYALVVSNLLAFQSKYTNYSTMTIAGQYDGNLNDAGDEVILHGKFDEPILDFTYSDSWYPSSDGDGYSLNIIDASAAISTWGLKDSWQLSNYVDGSPGTDNSGLRPGSICINELLAHSDLATGDWVELKNTTTDAINIGGWWLSDTRTDLQRYQIAAGTVLQPGGFLVLTESANFANPADPGCHTAFGYSEYGETAFLTGTDAQGRLTGYREEQAFDASDREVAFTRYVTSTGNVDFVAESANTPLAANAPPKIGPVVINEVMYHPLNDTDEFIELYNNSGAAVLLYDSAHPANTWKLAGGLDFVFPAGLSIPAYGYLLVVNTDAVAFRTRYGVPAGVQIIGSYTGLLDNAGDNVKLYKPGDPDPLPPYEVPYYLVDRVEYNNTAPWPTSPNGLGPSLERLSLTAYGNDVVNWYAGPDEGTPGRVNGTVDVTPPRVVTATAPDGDGIHLVIDFNEAVDPVTSRTVANYSIPGLTVSSADAGSNNGQVILTTSPMTSGTYYTVTVTGVKNLAGLTIAGANTGLFSYAGTGVGLWGQYYQYPPGNINWSNLKVARLDPTINFDWVGGSPDPLLLSDLFSVRWTGKVKAFYTESYTFYTVSEDGVRLWVNNQLLIDHWTEHAATEDSGTIAMVAGQKYDIKIEYYENAGLASMKLSWSSAHTPKAIVPTSALFSNAVPAATVPDYYSVAANTVLTVPAGTGVLVNDADPAGYSLTATLRRRAGHGTVTVRSDGGFTYTPTAGYSGPDTFSYYAYNGLVNSAETMVYVLVDTSPVVNGMAVNWDEQARGLGATYYQYGAGGVDWANPRLTRRDATVDFDWGTGSPDPLLAADKFAVRWMARLQSTYSELYTFYAYSDAGARVWIDDKLVIDQWTAHTAAEQSGTIALSTGQLYTVRVEYYEDSGPATMKLSWSSLNQAKEVIPASALTPIDGSFSFIDPGAGGLKTIDVFFNKDITYNPEDIVLQKVTFNGNSEVLGDIITPEDVHGFGFNFLRILLPAGAVQGSWLKVTLKGSGTFRAFENLKLRLDGEPLAGGTGHTYAYSPADLPTGNGFEGGDTVFYVGSLRGDFGSVGGGPTGDGQFTPEDIDSFLARMQAGDKAADFRGVGFADNNPDGQLTPADFDGFMTLYQQTAGQPRVLAPLPNPGPQGEGAPQPLAAGQPDPVTLAAAPAADASEPLAAGGPIAVSPVLAEAPSALALEVDVLAMALRVDAAGVPPAPLAALPAAELPLVEPIVMLTAVGAPATWVPLASAGAEEVAPLKYGPFLSPDGGAVDLLTLPALDVMLVA